MKILVLNGSPRGEKSNTIKLTNAFVSGLCEVGENTVETVELNKLDIKGCRGCFACWKGGEGKCVIKDDMPGVLEKILWADMIIYSFPLYYFGIPGQMKNMIDRCLPNVLPFMAEREDGVGSGSHMARYDFSGKKYGVISTCGFYSAKGNYDAVCGMFDHICGKDRFERIFCGQGELFSIPSLSERTNEYLGYIRDAGREYAGGGISDAIRDKLAELLYPKEVFEEMADASWGINKETGEKESECHVFTRQMAALYNRKSWDGKDRVLEICYTDKGETYQIKLTKDGYEVFTGTELTYTTRIDTPWEVWKDISVGKVSGSGALAKHLYTVKGDFSLMIKWDEFFGRDKNAVRESSAAPAAQKKKPLMAAMIGMWMVLWIAVPIDTLVGALIAAGVCAVMPLILHGREITIYDKLTCAAVTIMSVLAVFLHTSGTDTVFAGRIAADGGYLIFGLMWLLSAFAKEPLCAAYVKYGYGGGKALDNPIFVTTNKILSLAWGILYVILAPVAFLLQSSFAPVVSIIVCNAAPMLMGAFTVWFEKWYPAHVAAG